MIDIVDPGPLGTVQDLGRPGHAALGVGASGAADRGSLRLANRLVGNVEQAAAVELTFGGLRAHFRRTVTVALTGAPCPVTVGGRAAPMNGPFSVRAGEELMVGRPDEGLRTYLAVRGGIDVPLVLGSRSTDVLARIGPPTLRPGSSLPIGAEALDWPNADLAPRASLAGEATVHVLPGPRDDWFQPEALAVLCSRAYEVTADSNRIGARLDGPALPLAVHRQLPPEGMVRGALQVPPDGRPILFLADHPVTGGYPVIAVVSDDDLDRTAQLHPGDRIRFRIRVRPD